MNPNISIKLYVSLNIDLKSLIIKADCSNPLQNDNSLNPIIKIVIA
jgi:hypothetical protein